MAQPTGVERVVEEHARLCVAGTPETCAMHSEAYRRAEEREEAKDEKPGTRSSSDKEGKG